MAEAFPFWRKRFIASGKALTAGDVARIQDNMSDCKRPERGLEYRKDSTDSQATTPEVPDPFGVDHEKVTPIKHTAQ